MCPRVQVLKFVPSTAVRASISRCGMLHVVDDDVEMYLRCSPSGLLENWK